MDSELYDKEDLPVLAGTIEEELLDSPSREVLAHIARFHPFAIHIDGFPGALLGELRKRWPFERGYEQDSEALLRHVEGYLQPFLQHLQEVHMMGNVRLVVNVSVNPETKIPFPNSPAVYAIIDAAHGIARHSIILPNDIPLDPKIGIVSYGLTLLCQPFEQGWEQMPRNYNQGGNLYAFTYKELNEWHMWRIDHNKRWASHQPTPTNVHPAPEGSTDEQILSIAEGYTEAQVESDEVQQFGGGGRLAQVGRAALAAEAVSLLAEHAKQPQELRNEQNTRAAEQANQTQEKTFRDRETQERRRLDQERYEAQKRQTEIILDTRNRGEGPSEAAALILQGRPETIPKSEIETVPILERPQVEMGLEPTRAPIETGDITLRLTGTEPEGGTQARAEVSGTAAQTEAGAQTAAAVGAETGTRVAGGIQAGAVPQGAEARPEIGPTNADQQEAQVRLSEVIRESERQQNEARLEAGRLQTQTTETTVRQNELRDTTARQDEVNRENVRLQAEGGAGTNSSQNEMRLENARGQAGVLPEGQVLPGAPTREGIQPQNEQTETTTRQAEINRENIRQQTEQRETTAQRDEGTRAQVEARQEGVNQQNEQRGRDVQQDQAQRASETRLDESREVAARQGETIREGDQRREENREAVQRRAEAGGPTPPQNMQAAENQLTNPPPEHALAGQHHIAQEMNTLHQTVEHAREIHAMGPQHIQTVTHATASAHTAQHMQEITDAAREETEFVAIPAAAHHHAAAAHAAAAPPLPPAHPIPIDSVEPIQHYAGMAHQMENIGHMAQHFSQTLPGVIAAAAVVAGQNAPPPPARSSSDVARGGSVRRVVAATPAVSAPPFAPLEQSDKLRAAPAKKAAAPARQTKEKQAPQKAARRRAPARVTKTENPPAEKPAKNIVASLVTKTPIAKKPAVTTRQGPVARTQQAETKRPPPRQAKIMDKPKRPREMAPDEHEGELEPEPE